MLLRPKSIIVAPKSRKYDDNDFCRELNVMSLCTENDLERLDTIYLMLSHMHQNLDAKFKNLFNVRAYFVPRIN